MSEMENGTQETQEIEMANTLVSGRSVRKRTNRLSSYAMVVRPRKRMKKSNESKTALDQQEGEDNNEDSDNPTERARHLITSWICAECKEAECITHPDSPLLVCEGPCLRLFHYPCARLSCLPSSNQPWICNDCIQSRHKCCVCQEYGTDNIEVYKCEKKRCGLFYHEQCLAMYDLVSIQRMFLGNNQDELEYKDDEEEQQEALNQQTLKFKCPAHSCWTCSGGLPLNEEEDDENRNMKQDDENDNIYCIQQMKNIHEMKKSNKKKIAALKLNTCFNEKSGDLIRCMECPNSFHITCISPKCRFHELALLCHDHAHTNKLPYLDYSTSVQGIVEAKVDEKFTCLGKKQILVTQTLSKSYRRENKFLPGLRGDVYTSDQAQAEQLLNGDDMVVTTGFSPSFYFPVEIRNEVHSKLPTFTQIQVNRMDPSNRPKRHPPTTECCQCQVSCDSHCLNRIAGIECVGNSDRKNDLMNPYKNCNLGPSCGNRSLASRAIAQCKPVRERGKGWGLITVHGVQKGGLVLEYVGEVIDEKTKRSRLEAWSIEHPNDPNFYIMSLEMGWYIDAREMGNLSRFINHSCDPNCILSRVIVSGYSRIAIVAIKDVAPGEFLSYDYHFDTKDGDKFVCRCGAVKCRGTMKGGVNIMDGDDESKRRSKKELWLQAKARLDKDKKFLDDITASENSRLRLGQLYLPGEENNETAPLISSGPQYHNFRDVCSSKVFLWRNVMRGANFHARYLRRILTKRK